MNRFGVSIAIAVFAGFAAVCILPPQWLAYLSAAAAICAFVLSILIRLDTKTKPHANPVAAALLSIVNLPEQPGAVVNEGWALVTFLALAAFLASLALSILVFSG